MAKSKEQDILKQGGELLLGKDYDGALECFNLVSHFANTSSHSSLLITKSLKLLSGDAGFTLSVDDRFIALDQRAVALIKLGKLEQALQDGRRMIKIKRGDSQVLFPDPPYLSTQHSSI